MAEQKMLHPYPEYKDSGVEWINEIPKSWSLHRLKDVADINMGQSPSSEEYSLEVLGLPFLQGNADFTDKYPIGRIYCSTPRKIAFKNQLLYSVRAPIGALNIADQSYGIGRGLCALDANDKTYNQFLWWLLPAYKYQFEAIATGSTFEAVSSEQIGNLKFALPPKEEQQKIADFLDDETEQMDRLIAKQERLIELLGEKRQAVISHAVAKGLNPDAPMKDSGVEWIGEIPAHWEVKKIKYLGTITSGASFPSTLFTSTATEESIRVIKISNIQTMRMDWEDQSFIDKKYLSEYQNFQVRKGDLVFALTRPIISTGIKASLINTEETYLLNQRNAVLKPFSETDINWFYYIVLSDLFLREFENLIDKTGQQPNISPIDISNISIPLPQYVEQKEIIQFLDTELAKMDALTAKAEQQIELLKERRTALISAAVTGKIDLRHWQPRRASQSSTAPRDS